VVTALVGFAYARPVTVFETWAALRLRLSGVRSAHVQAGPYRLHYLEAGSGPALVLVHGLSSNATQDWGRLVAPLGRRFHVYAPDLPGFGRSERPPTADYSIPMQVEALRAFMQAVGLGRARVAGLSMGGWIVSRLAGEHPAMVERLVVVDGAGMRPDGPDSGRGPPARDEEGVRRLVATVPTTPRSLLRSSPGTSWPAGGRRWIARRDPRSMAAGRDWLDGTLAQADHAGPRPVGKQDRLIPVEYAARLQAEFPHADLRVLDGCGHVPMADCPEAFDRELLRFLAAAEGPAAP
jgi:pimeloyl-ACP methyl ester carboxylesterase